LILALKTLICWILLEKREPYRDSFLEKAIKKDIYAALHDADVHAYNCI
jgi:hypothetical protein